MDTAHPETTVDPLAEDIERHRAKALAMGGEAKLAKRKAAGILNARERIDHLLDPESFIESGMFAVSNRPEDKETTPADGKVGGYGRIDGRPVAVVSNDFTVKGASSARTNMLKIGQIKRNATESGMPIVFLGESSGARMPDNMGATGMSSLLGNDPQQYVRERETPWATAILGNCFGSSAWYACLSDFTVMRKGAVMAVASPVLASMATGETVEPEELGGAKFHSEVTGLVDAIVDTDEEALALIRRFLSYLPSHSNETPPRAPVPHGSDEAGEKVADLLPESRTRVYDMKRIVRAIVDRDSFLEFKPKFGKVLVTGLARIGGRTVGILANNPMIKGGALDVPACEKATRLLVMCDSFNIPVILLVDTPGFIIGKETERQRGPAKIMNFMTALQLCSMPKLSVIVRKSYGQAYLNMGGGRNSTEVAAWPTAEVSFMDPTFGTKIITWGRDLDPEGEEFTALRDRMAEDSSAWKLAENYGAQFVIHPAETRRYLTRMLEVHELRRTNGIGRHRMSNWPWC